MKVLFIVGPPRSGTTLLGTILSKVEGVVYIEEPNFIWRSSAPFRSDDVYTKKDASIENIKRIKRRLMSEVDGDLEGFDLMVEKTPANCLRLDYLKAIFPNSKFIFLYREHSSIVSSMKKKWSRESDANSMKLDGIKSHKINHFKKMVLRIRTLSFIDLFAYLPRMIGELGFLLSVRKRNFWGVRYKGWKQDVINGLSLDDMALNQVSICYGAIESFKLKLKSDEYICVNYGDLISMKNSVNIESIVGIQDIDVKVEQARVNTVVV